MISLPITQDGMRKKSLSNTLARILDYERIGWEKALKLWERCTFMKNFSTTLTCYAAHTTSFSNIIDRFLRFLGITKLLVLVV